MEVLDDVVVRGNLIGCGHSPMMRGVKRPSHSKGHFGHLAKYREQHPSNEFCYGVSWIPERYLEVPNVFFNLSR
jgi:hypothetical protein